MKLYENEILFKELVARTSEYFNMRLSLIEKDYYIYLLLKDARKLIPGLVFKGGTSLSKCFNIIDRFSEDIDLTLDLEHFSQKYKRESLKTLINIASSEPFSLVNKEVRKGHTHANYNDFTIDFKQVYKDETALPSIKMEMVYLTKCYPCEERSFAPYIGQYLEKVGRPELIEGYELTTISLQVQTLERTFIDKVFALCDYFEATKPFRNSRHIYDLFKIYPKIDTNSPSFLKLILEVKEDRKKSERSISAQDNYDINKTLRKIINSAYFEQDYNEITSKLLYSNEDYKTVTSVLEKIIDDAVFNSVRMLNNEERDSLLEVLSNPPKPNKELEELFKTK